MRIKQFFFTMMVMILCSAFTAVAQDVSGGDSQSPPVTVGGNEPTEEQKSVLNELLQEIALNSSITGDIANLDS